MFSTKTGAAGLSIISNSALVGLKVAVGLSMGSVSVLSEGVHSAVDLLAALIAFFSIRAAARPPDEEHQFGHGKIENVSGAIEALLIFGAAGLIIYEAADKIRTGTELESMELGIGIMAASGLVNFFVSRHLHRVARASDSVALEADAWHLTTDVYTSLGVMAGLVVVRITDLTVLDPIIAILVALLIMRAAWRITRKSVGGLLDGRGVAGDGLVGDVGHFVQIFIQLPARLVPLTQHRSVKPVPTGAGRPPPIIRHITPRMPRCTNRC